MPLKEFDTFWEAFDYCRDVNKPVIVRVMGEAWKLYPSGSAKRANTVCTRQVVGCVESDGLSQPATTCG